LLKRRVREMSYQEKRTVTTLLSGAVVLTVYVVYALNKLSSGGAGVEDLQFWGRTMLMFIGVSAAAIIIIQIVFHILLSMGIAVKSKIQDEEYDDKQIEKDIKAEMVEDERDKLIELKAMRAGSIFAGVGFVAALLSLVLGYSSVVMLNVLFISFGLSCSIEGIAQLYFYRAGVKNG